MLKRPSTVITRPGSERRNTQLHYIVTDITGTARELCSEEGKIHWRGEQELWGQYLEARLPVALRRFTGDAANEEVSCDLRYQGQLFDAESGLYYNRYRYYDPDIGQYISSDPIGLAGGIRPQGYVHNPVEWVDPLGLAKNGCGGTPKDAQKKVNKGQGPKDIKRIDEPEQSVPGSQWHAHQTKPEKGKHPALNLDGSNHDGPPSFSKKTLKWLQDHGWNTGD